MLQVPTDPRLHMAFDIAAWGAGVALTFVLYRWRLRAVTQRVAGLTDRGYFIALGLGAIFGAYLFGSFDAWRAGLFALSHSLAGALAGAIVSVEGYKLARGIKGSTGIVFAAPLALGIAVGRWGCLFAGLPDGTYGIPWRGPLAVDLGDGVARVPVQILESASMAVFLMLLLWGLWGRRSFALNEGFYWLAAWYGAQRFAWEFFKPYPHLVGPFNVFHVLCAGLVAYGITMVVRQRRSAAA